MGERNVVGRSCQNRLVLGNLTNRPLKRDLSSILGDSGFGKNVDGVDVDSRFSKRMRIKAAKCVKENSIGSCGKLCNTLAPSRLNKELESDCSPTSSEADTALSNVPRENLQFNLLNDESRLVQDDKQRSTHGDVLGNPCLSSSVVPTCSGSDKKDCSGIMRSNAENEAAVDCDFGNDENDIVISTLASSNQEATEWSKLPKSEGFMSMGLERCSLLKSDIDANLDVCNDLLKTCSCSFCLKASYIWSDLHYQDIKGRITALKKSQKDASSLAQKTSKEKESCPDEDNSQKSNLEFDLSGQWVSLFHQMEHMFAQEGSQLQTSFLAMKEMREECKTDLEMLNGMPTKKQ